MSRPLIATEFCAENDMPLPVVDRRAETYRRRAIELAEAARREDDKSRRTLLARPGAKLHAVNATGVQFEDKETRHDGAVTSASIDLLDGFRHVAPIWQSHANSVSA